nr:MAG TPA: hypothetical protein [Bacteriophage sp.]
MKNGNSCFPMSLVCAFLCLDIDVAQGIGSRMIPRI